MNGIMNVNDINAFSPMFYASAPCDMQLVGFDDALQEGASIAEEE